MSLDVRDGQSESIVDGSNEGEIVLALLEFAQLGDLHSDGLMLTDGLLLGILLTDGASVFGTFGAFATTTAEAAVISATENSTSTL